MNNVHVRVYIVYGKPHALESPCFFARFCVPVLTPETSDDVSSIHSGSHFQRHSVTPGKSDDSPVFPPAGSVENGGLTGVGYFYKFSGHVSTQ